MYVCMYAANQRDTFRWSTFEIRIIWAIGMNVENTHTFFFTPAGLAIYLGKTCSHKVYPYLCCALSYYGICCIFNCLNVDVQFPYIHFILKHQFNLYHLIGFETGPSKQIMVCNPHIVYLQVLFSWDWINRIILYKRYPRGHSFIQAWQKQVQKFPWMLYK